MGHPSGGDPSTNFNRMDQDDKVNWAVKGLNAFAIATEVRLTTVLANNAILWLLLFSFILEIQIAFNIHKLF